MWSVQNYAGGAVWASNDETKEKIRLDGVLQRKYNGFAKIFKLVTQESSENPEQSKVTGKHYFFNDQGKVSDYFCDVGYSGSLDYEVVKKTPDDFWQIMDKDFNLSEQFYKVVCISESKDNKGLAVVRKNQDSGKQILNVDGTMSEEFYDVLERGYHDGYNIVKKTKDSGFQYIDSDFNLSEEFYKAGHYYYGMAAVRKTPYSYWHFRDTQGNISESFYEVERYREGGFAKVKPLKGKAKWRDLLGNLSDKQTQLGKDYFKYINRKITVYDLCDECFGNDDFLQRILAQEQFDLEYYCSLCQTQEDLNRLYESASEISDYVKGKAYEEYVKSQAQGEEQASFIHEQPQQPENLVTEEQRQEMIEKLSKVF